MRTVTFDETKFAIVPIEPTEGMIQAFCLNQQEGDFKTYLAWWNSHSSGTSERIRNYCVKDYRGMIAAAPPYLESNFVESLDSSMPVGFLDHGGVFYPYKDMPKDTTELYIKPAPKEPE